jgi:hypothetical protein
VPVIRTHARYYCRSEVIYVNAQVTLRRCISGSQDPQTCAPLEEDTATHNSATGVNYAVGHYEELGTADSDPYPKTGWYVATAVYEVCVFNGGVFPGTQQSRGPCGGVS